MKNTRKLPGLLLAALMAATALPAAARANGAATGNTVNGQYENGEWQGNAGSGTISYDNDALALSKTAVDKGNGEFGIALTVKKTVTPETHTRPADTATALVLDVSNSMNRKSRLLNLKSVITGDGGFLQRLYNSALVDGEAAAKRWVSVVVFSTDASIEQNWVDIAAADELESLKAEINSLSANGNTNLDAGLHAAYDLLGSPSDAGGLDKSKKQVVVFTDGETNRNNRTDKQGSAPWKDAGDYTAGPGTDDAQDKEFAAEGAAKVRTEAGALYTIAYSTEEEYTTFLRDKIASAQDNAYSAGDEAGLNDAFDAICTSIEESTSVVVWPELTIRDPMSGFVAYVDGSLPEGIAFADGTIAGTLPDPTDVISNNDGTKTAVWTFKYTVKLKDEWRDGEFRPSNAPTTLTEDETDYPFPVPGVRDKAATSVAVEKQWLDKSSGRDNTDWPGNAAVTVQLMRNGENEGEPVELTAAKTSHIFEDLPACANGAMIAYTVAETAASNVPAGFTAAVTGNGNGSFTILNERPAPGTTSVTVTKVWKDADGTDMTPPPDKAVTVKVFNGNAAVEGQEYTFPAGTADWTHTFTGLPVKDASGGAVDYTVREDPVPDGFTAAEGSAANGFTITNRQEQADCKPALEIHKNVCGDGPSRPVYEFTLTLEGGGNDHGTGAGPYLAVHNYDYQNRKYETAKVLPTGAFAFNFKLGNGGYAELFVPGNWDLNNYDYKVKEAFFSNKCNVKPWGGAAEGKLSEGGTVTFTNTFPDDDDREPIHYPPVICPIADVVPKTGDRPFFWRLYGLFR